MLIVIKDQDQVINLDNITDFTKSGDSEITFFLDLKDSDDEYGRIIIDFESPTQRDKAWECIIEDYSNDLKVVYV